MFNYFVFCVAVLFLASLKTNRDGLRKAKFSNTSMKAYKSFHFKFKIEFYHEFLCVLLETMDQNTLHPTTMKIVKKRDRKLIPVSGKIFMFYPLIRYSLSRVTFEAFCLSTGMLKHNELDEKTTKVFPPMDNTDAIELLFVIDKVTERVFNLFRLMDICPAPRLGLQIQFEVLSRMTKEFKIPTVDTLLIDDISTKTFNKSFMRMINKDTAPNNIYLDVLAELNWNKARLEQAISKALKLFYLSDARVGHFNKNRLARTLNTPLTEANVFKIIRENASWIDFGNKEFNCNPETDQGFNLKEDSLVIHCLFRAVDQKSFIESLMSIRDEFYQEGLETSNGTKIRFIEMFVIGSNDAMIHSHEYNVSVKKFVSHAYNDCSDDVRAKLDEYLMKINLTFLG